MCGAKQIIPLLVLLLLIPVVSADFASDFQEVQGQVEGFLSGEDVLVIQGRYASAAEKGALAYVKSRYPEYDILKEKDFTEVHGEALVLIGGPKQNLIAKQLLNDPSFTSEKQKLTIGSVEFLEGEKGKVVVFSDAAGYANEPKKLSKSPLAKIMPEELIPVAATAIGLGLVWLWHLFGKVLLKVFRYKVADKVMGRVKKKKLKEKFKGFHLFGVRIKIREWIAITVTCIVFAASITYIYLSPGEAVKLLLISIIINLIMYSIRNLTRLFMDKHYKLHTEYHVWYWGLFLTAITGFLGNGFCLTGYVVSDESKKEEAWIAYIINLVAFIAFLGFVVWNFLRPSVILQMTTVLFISYTMLQMLPFTPFVGKSIYKWRKGVWAVTFVPIIIAYVLVGMF